MEYILYSSVLFTQGHRRSGKKKQVTSESHSESFSVSVNRSELLKAEKKLEMSLDREQTAHFETNSSIKPGNSLETPKMHVTLILTK